MFEVSGLVTAYKNSLIITSASVVMIVVVSGMTAFIIQRRKQRWVGVVNGFIILGMTMPGFIVPTYFLLRNMNLLHSYLGICLVYTCLLYTSGGSAGLQQKHGGGRQLLCRDRWLSLIHISVISS